MNSAKAWAWIRQIARFGVVGIAATGVHALIYQWACRGGMPPLRANFTGFCGAFLISFLGHRYWTFADTAGAARASLPKFFVTALLGLASNTLMTWLLVVRLQLPPAAALPGILFVTPALVFLSSKYWAFAPAPRAG